MSELLLTVRNVCKRFPGVRALHNVNLSLAKGDVLAVLGENGAGKSTLMKILAGVQQPEEGEILLEGQVVEIKSVQAALKLGIALIHQELNLADNLDVAANIFLGREPRKLGMIDKARQCAEAKQFLAMVGLDIEPTTLVRDLTIGHQQMVEIAKALSVNARVLIMDEPTSSLTHKEAEQLFKVIKDLSGRGVSIVYISHRLSEVRAVAHRVVVLRDGENAGELATNGITHEAMVKLMVGRELSQFYPHAPHTPGEVVLTVKGLRTPVHPTKEIELRLRAGEIVGMAGLVGAGRTELLLTLFGVTPAQGGTIEVAGKETKIGSPIDAIAAGLALVPEDRKQQGVILEMAVRENLSLASLLRDQKSGFLNRAKENEISRQMIEQMKVKTPSEGQLVQFLSGGNQQKVVLGKWLAMNPKVLLLDEPTRGIDVGAKSEIYGLMEELAGEGMAILFVSSDMEEVLGMSDRALVMHEGCITGELAREELSEEAVMQLATGGEMAGLAGV
ncbi:MAG: sugar transporter ATP-binding protein [Verrucomicrobia bacterium]|jgi:ribose transport system ATP-binding protein|nr:sugar transporter ATP-binding protein [Verrucomicrobiota bacterium]